MKKKDVIFMGVVNSALLAFLFICMSVSMGIPHFFGAVWGIVTGFGTAYIAVEQYKLYKEME